jgi:hypothetical protein
MVDQIIIFVTRVTIFFLLNDFLSILMEDRPYWWIPDQSGSYGAQIEPLHQFPVTCETGPGSPSGHVMVSAATWLMLVPVIVDLLKPCVPDFCYKRRFVIISRLSLPHFF